jgi:hypothetical protein
MGIQYFAFSQDFVRHCVIFATTGTGGRRQVQADAEAAGLLFGVVPDPEVLPLVTRIDEKNCYNFLVELTKNGVIPLTGG